MGSSGLEKLTWQYPEKAYGVPARDILVEPGNRSTIGGQEDMIEDLALTMAKEKI